MFLVILDLPEKWQLFSRMGGRFAPGSTLDNVATSIYKKFNKVILYDKDDKVFINGYRVYVVDEIAKGIKADIRLKLLPVGEIRSYNERMNNALSIFENKLDDDSWV